MIRLDNTTRKLQAVLASAITTNQLPVLVSWSDKTSSSYDGGSTLINTNGTTAVDIVAAPAASTIRDIDFIAIQNADTAEATITIRYNDNGTLFTLFKVILAVGDQLTYTHGSGLQLVDSTGALKGSSSNSGIWPAPRDLSLTGDATATLTGVDGSADVSAALTLATVNAGIGTFGDSTSSSVVTVNAKGLVTAASEITVTPAIASVTGLGTGVGTALSTNVGSAGSPVVNGGALGTPSSGVATNLTGTAAGLTSGNATKWATARNLSLTGDATGTISAVDGSANASGALTLATVNANVGSFGAASKTLSATVNAKGLVTAMSQADIAIANSQVSGLGTMSTQNANNIAVTGGYISATKIDSGGVLLKTNTGKLSVRNTGDTAAAQIEMASIATGTPDGTKFVRDDGTLAVPAGGGASGAKLPCRVATTANITLAGGAPNTLDGATLAANDRILVKAQTTASQNGLYYVSTLGTGANGTWTRATDADGAGDMFGGMLVAVSEGTVAADSLWMLTTNDPITIGTTALTFARIKVLSADLLGTTTNDNAAAGVVGEYVESVVPLASSISISDATYTNVTSISLTAGDWDISANFGIAPAATTDISVFSSGTSLTSATVDAADRITDRRSSWVPSAPIYFSIAPRRFSLASTTTVYLVGYVDFSVSTCNIYGKISARRVR